MKSEDRVVQEFEAIVRWALQEIEMCGSVVPTERALTLYLAELLEQAIKKVYNQRQ